MLELGFMKCSYATENHGLTQAQVTET